MCSRPSTTWRASGSTPLVVSDGARVLGVIELKDIVKGGIKERFAELRRMGIKTVMITGDNRLTAAAIAAEAGVDDFLAEATPEAKLKLIRDYQAEGRLVAMTGDGTNDAPALAQADVAVAMNTGTQAAKEAGNMVDLDSNPTKLLEIVETGKQMLMTRGSLTTFSIANDVAKYFAIIPAAFATTYPQLAALNVMHLHSPSSAILSAVIFNALVIIFLIPLALKGVKYRALGAAALLRRNVLIYGLGGLIVPFIGIKVIDLLLGATVTRLRSCATMTSILRPALVLFALLSVLVGIVYPLLVTGIAQAVFPAQAAGSLIVRDGKAVGSSLIGQSFSDAEVLLGPPVGHRPDGQQRQRLRRLEPGAAEPGAGRCRQGPHRSPARSRPGQHRAGAGGSGHRLGQRPGPAHQRGAARCTRQRASPRQRKLPQPQVQQLIGTHSEGRLFGFIGEPRVNVLQLNLALDGLQIEDAGEHLPNLQGRASAVTRSSCHER